MSVIVRDVSRADRPGWQPLWDGYNAFYGRAGPTALDGSITELTWIRFFDPVEPVHCVVAIAENGIAGFAHYLFHRSTTRSGDVCYLQDLFTAENLRGFGVGAALIAAVARAAECAGSSRLYWLTKQDNQIGRKLYDKVAKHDGFIVYAREL